MTSKAFTGRTKTNDLIGRRFFFAGDRSGIVTHILVRGSMVGVDMDDGGLTSFPIGACTRESVRKEGQTWNDWRPSKT